MNLDALLHVFYLDVYEFEVYDLFSRPQTRILRGIAVLLYDQLAYTNKLELITEGSMFSAHFCFIWEDSCFTKNLRLSKYETK